MRTSFQKQSRKPRHRRSLKNDKSPRLQFAVIRSASAGFQYRHQLFAIRDRRLEQHRGMGPASAQEFNCLGIVLGHCASSLFDRAFPSLRGCCQFVESDEWRGFNPIPSNRSLSGGFFGQVFSRTRRINEFNESSGYHAD